MIFSLTNTFVIFKELPIVSTYVSQLIGRFNCTTVHVYESVGKANHSCGGSDKYPNGTTNDIFHVTGKNGNTDQDAGEESAQMCCPVDCSDRNNKMTSGKHSGHPYTHLYNVQQSRTIRNETKESNNEYRAQACHELFLAHGVSDMILVSSLCFKTSEKDF